MSPDALTPRDHPLENSAVPLSYPRARGAVPQCGCLTVIDSTMQ
ncbi:MAG: hypothetical protein PHS47_04100 [Methanocellales archaeon]|nr:hypothetical protein [Methanocellales archaeon]MDD4898665.1 hypothetical protein [Methanocellales archaeon]MDD5447347.1 hypothetical protein [Methanocellales archaeon]